MKENKKQFLSFKETLAELDLSEEELKAKVNSGEINVFHQKDGNMLFDAYEIENLTSKEKDENNDFAEEDDDEDIDVEGDIISSEYMSSEEIPKRIAQEQFSIDDENLYQSTDGTFDSLFLSRSVVAEVESSARKDKKNKKNKKEENKSKAKKRVTEEIKGAIITDKELTQNNSTDKELTQSNSTSEPQKDLEEYNEDDSEFINTENYQEEFHERENYLKSKYKVDDKESDSVKSEEYLDQKEAVLSTMSMKWYIILAIIFSFFIVFFVISIKLKKSKNVSFIEVEKDDFIPSLKTKAILLPIKENLLYPNISGKVLKTYKKKGDKVIKGDVIALLENDTLNQEISEVIQKKRVAELKLVESFVTLEIIGNNFPEKIKKKMDEIRKRAEGIEIKIKTKEKEIQKNKHDIIKKQEIQEIINKLKKDRENFLGSLLKNLTTNEKKYYTYILKYRIAYEELEEIKNKMSFLREKEKNLFVYSSFSGIITGNWIETGSKVNIHKPMLKISDKRIKISANIRGEYIPLIKKDSLITLDVPSINKNFSLKIHSIEEKDSSISDFKSVDIYFCEDSINIPQKTFAVISMIFPEKKIKCIRIPKENLIFIKDVDFGEKPAVIQYLSENKIVKRVLEIGLSSQYYVQVKSGLKKGDKIVNIDHNINN